MPLWVLYVMPPLAGIGVFVTGVVIDGGEFEPVDWCLYGFSTLLVLFFVTVGILGLTYSYTELEPHATTPFGVLAKRNLWGLAALGLFAVGLVFGFARDYMFRPFFTGGGLYLQSFWLFTACVACLGGLIMLLSIAHRRTIGGRVTCGVVIAFLALAAWQPGVWLSWRESIRYYWDDYRAKVKDEDDEARLAERQRSAARMIELRPDDWRGHVRRYEVRKRMGNEDRFADAREAIRLGCDESSFWSFWSFRKVLMFDYHETGQFMDAVREGKALVSLEDQPEDSLIFTSGHLAAVQLDAGEYDGVIAYHTHMKALGRENGRTRSLAGCALLARGEYVAANAILSEPSPVGDENPEVSLAWLLATCPDVDVRDPARSLVLIDAYLPRIEQVVRDIYKNLGKTRKPWYRPMEEVLAEVKREAQPAKAAGLAEAGRWDEARAVFDQWKKDEGWDHKPHHNGFWASRYARLDLCLREGKPYREEPSK